MASEPIKIRNPKSYQWATTDHLVGRDRCDTNLDYLRAHLVGYDVHSLIRSGGQAEVYRATHCPTDREVAIKLLLDGPIASEQQRQRIIREGQYLGRLNHPNIVSIYHAGELSRRNYLVMQYVDGRPIDEYAVLKNLDVHAILSMFVQVCDALSMAHEHGIIHRDIKPTNILVGTDGVPRVVDFGFAQAAYDDSARLSGSMTLVGTLPYLSPERVEKGIADSRSDVYALGITLFETMTDAFPFPVEGQREEVIQQVRTAKRLSLRQGIALAGTNEAVTVGDIHDDIEKVVAKAIAPDPELRYRTARELQEDLQRYLRGEAVAAKSTNTLYVLRKTIWRYRLYATVGLVILAATLGGLAIAASGWRRAERVVFETQTALEMAGLQYAGSLQRGSGLHDDAVESFEAAIALAKSTGVDSPDVRLQAYRAHHWLAEHYYAVGKIEAARPHVMAALGLAKQIRESSSSRINTKVPDSFILRGRLALYDGSYADAAAAFLQAARDFRELTTGDVGPSIYRSYEANARSLAGQAYMKSHDLEGALSTLAAAVDLYETVVRDFPTNTDLRLEYANTLGRCANAHIRRSGTGDAAAAQNLIERALGVLDATTGTTRQDDLRSVRRALTINLEKVRSLRQ